MLLVNLYGAPGAGKSTGAAYVFSKLKLEGINVELATEFAKEKVWEGNTEVFKNQAYIFGEQFYRISRCAEKVDVVVTDSPLLLSVFYNNNFLLGDSFCEMVKEVSESYEKLDYFVIRSKKYEEAGRLQTEKESDDMVEEMKLFLHNYDVSFAQIEGSVSGYTKVVSDVLKRLQGEDLDGAELFENYRCL